MSKRLELVFENEDGGSVTLFVEDPAEPAVPQDVSEAMDAIIDADVFYSAGGKLTGKRSARIVERTVEPIEFE
ncbi:hypothetical protein CR205_01960 [Alteribacter lacisalsi]|jgi:hypothetical protein|uniref:DUF2922 domain-containing protein n=1 Tax=Alteribacter lacisalsi TaxID=2045244 RepID=A0A2W0H8Z6_9BACI|nr:DUF2922 domain-containing protein [Alteribacter lacisalsi]PYZ97391.1 hypothetical protein CR205_01960 [Alteribacter lacisalsi]